MRRNMMALTVVAVLALAACGGDDAETTSAAGSNDKAAASQSSTDGAVGDAENCEELIEAAQPLSWTSSRSWSTTPRR